jgi:tetratricopeptide (TPR) repeat protein
MRVLLPVALVMSLAAVVDADSTPPAPRKDSASLDAKGRAAYLAAMKRGRAAAQKHDDATAIAAFQSAIGVAPDDASALSELGLAALHANNLPLAEKCTQRAVELADKPATRAGALYNLGLIAEAKGDKAAAADAYRRSLAERPNTTVESHLVKVDEKAAAAVRARVNLPGACGKPSPPPEDKDYGNDDEPKTNVDFEIDFDRDGVPDVTMGRNCDGRNACEWALFVMRGACGHRVGAIRYNGIVTLDSSHNGLADVEISLDYHRSGRDERYRFNGKEYVLYESRSCDLDEKCEHWRRE